MMEKGGQGWFEKVKHLSDAILLIAPLLKLSLPLMLNALVLETQYITTAAFVRVKSYC
jgi:hypothetical protein